MIKAIIITNFFDLFFMFFPPFQQICNSCNSMFFHDSDVVYVGGLPKITSKIATLNIDNTENNVQQKVLLTLTLWLSLAN